MHGACGTGSNMNSQLAKADTTNISLKCQHGSDRISTWAKLDGMTPIRLLPLCANIFYVW